MFEGCDSIIGTSVSHSISHVVYNSLDICLHIYHRSLSCPVLSFIRYDKGQVRVILIRTGSPCGIFLPVRAERRVFPVFQNLVLLCSSA